MKGSLIMTIKNNHLRKGNDNAPLKLEVFANVSCPGSAYLYNVAKDVFQEYIDNGQLQLVIKLWDKPREELLPGTLIHLSLDNSKPEEAIQTVESLLATQEEWHEFSDKELKQLLIDKYNGQVEERLENVDVSLAITHEAIERGVKYVPTIFLNGEEQPLDHYKFTADDIRGYIENALAKVK